MSSEKLEAEPKNPRLVKRPRPGHADLAGGQKFQARDLRNILERASARETAARVACGALAKQLLEEFGVEIKSHVIKLGSIPEATALRKHGMRSSAIPNDSPLELCRSAVEAEMIALDRPGKKGRRHARRHFRSRREECLRSVSARTSSWNEKLDGRIAQAFMSIHAVKAVEIGDRRGKCRPSGFEVHDEIFYENDAFHPQNKSCGRPRRRNHKRRRIACSRLSKTDLDLAKAFIPWISTPKQEDLAAFERSDITAVPAAGVIGEAMLACLANACGNSAASSLGEAMLAIVLANSVRERLAAIP